MSGYDGTMDAALVPVRAALLDTARREAERLLAQSAAEAERTSVEASTTAQRLRDEARSQGAADAAAVLAAERARVGRQAREIILRSRREGFEALRSAVVRALAQVREGEEYRWARLKMIEVVKDVLGPEAQLREGDGGGVIGESGGRRVDCSLARFADRATEAVAAEYPTASNDGSSRGRGGAQ